MTLGLDWPDGLHEAFLAYETALMADDLAALDALFLDDPGTLRGDAAGLLVGHDAISAFRRGRGGAPARELEASLVRVLSDSVAVVVAVTRPRSGGRGLQTQTWMLTADGWRIADAHVALPAPAIDTRVWRVVGSPLVAGAASDIAGSGAGPDGSAGSTAAPLPLAGETVAVKDLFAVAGQRVGGGVRTYLSGAPVETAHAPAVAALLEAGASVTGIAQTDEFAYSIAGRNSSYGTPPNAVVPGAIPGGSSSGPATAVASGQVTIGLGTDTGGSIRVPASYQGLWGLRTTHGAVSREGLLPLAPTFDTVGWMTRDAGTLRRVAEVSLAAPAAAAEPGELLVDLALLAHADPAVQSAFGRAVAGLPVREVALGDAAELFEIYRVVQASEAWQAHGAWIEAHPGSLADDVAARFAIATAIDAATAAEARAAHAAARARLDAVLGQGVLLLPATSSPAPSAVADAAAIDRARVSTMRLTCIAGLTGRPGLSAPLLAVDVPGLATPAPVGLGLVGPPGADLALIDRALMIAAEQGVL